MIAADLSFYESTYRGGMPSTIGDDFYRLWPKAGAYLYQITAGRIESELTEDVANRVKLAYCGLIDALLLNEQGGGVVTESNDGVSVTYQSMYSKSSTTDNQRLYEAAVLYLGGTGLLYRGVGH